MDAELFRLDSVIRWLDSADGRIKRATADAAGAGEAPARQETETGPIVKLRIRTGVTR